MFELFRANINTIESIFWWWTWWELVTKYTKALHEWDVDTCIACVRSWNRKQKDQMQKIWKEKYPE